MPKKKPTFDPGKYSYSQFAFRVSKTEKDELQSELKALHSKFNKGRDKENPKGRKAAKINDIAYKALKIGILALQKQSKWEFED